MKVGPVRTGGLVVAIAALVAIGCYVASRPDADFPQMTDPRVQTLLRLLGGHP
jgi:hypothetical protein